MAINIMLLFIISIHTVELKCEQTYHAVQELHSSFQVIYPNYRE